MYNIRAINQINNSNASVLCAVSGGADSVYMLHRLLEYRSPKADCSARGERSARPGKPLKIGAAHFNHKLRGEESDRDAEFVRELVDKLNVDGEARVQFFRGEGDARAYAAEHKLGIEDAARQLRYEFLSDTAARYGYDLIATAHTADDNIETMLLNLCRGSGARGFCGIPPVRGNIIRPILDVTRAEIEEYFRNAAEIEEHCRNADTAAFGGDVDNVRFADNSRYKIPSVDGAYYITDSSNFSDEYARNRVRRYVMPVLRSVNAGAAENAAGLAELLRQDEEYLSSLAEDFLRKNSAVFADCVRIDARELSSAPPSISGRALRLVCGQNISRRHVSAVLDLCGKRGGRRDIPGYTAAYGGGFVFISPRGTPADYGANPAAARIKFPPVYLNTGEKTEIGGLGVYIYAYITDKYAEFSDKYAEITGKISDASKINRYFNKFYFQCDKICGRILVNAYSGGAKIRPAGRNVYKSLKKLMQEGGVPPFMRDRALVLSDDCGIFAVIAPDVTAEHPIVTAPNVNADAQVDKPPLHPYKLLAADERVTSEKPHRSNHICLMIYTQSS